MDLRDGSELNAHFGIPSKGLEVIGGVKLLIYKDLFVCPHITLIFFPSAVVYK